jgi:uncharacterized protein (TIGR02246 family)
MSRLLAGVCLLALAAAPAFAQRRGEPPKKATDPAVSKISSEYQAATNARDVSKLIGLYADDAIEMPPNQPMLRGKASIEGYYKKQFDEGTPKLMLEPMESAIAGTVAYEVGTYTQTITPKAGARPINDKGKYVVLLKQTSDRQWRVEYAIYNSDNPPPTPAGAAAPRPAPPK